MWYSAPELWPRLPDQILQANDPAHVAAAYLQRHFTQANGGRIAAIHAEKVSRRGILYVMLVVHEQDGERWCFVYPEANAHVAGHWAGVSVAARELGALEPAVYAPEPLTGGKPVSPWRALTAESFRIAPDDDLRGEWAAWWQTQDEQSFMQSDCLSAMSRAYKALDGVASYVLGHFLKEWGLIEDARIGLPDEVKTFAVRGPAGVPAVLRASQEKGLWWCFNTEQTEPSYRDGIWHLFADLVEQIRSEVQRRGFPADPPQMRAFPNWWRGFIETLGKQAQLGKEPTAVALFVSKA